MRSIWMGGLIAPLVAPLIFFFAIMVMAISKDGWGAGMHDWAQGLGLVAIITLPISYLATWCFGVPYIYWLRSISRLSRYNVCFGSLIIGVLSAWAFQLIIKVGRLDALALLLGAIIGMALSLAVALVFCWVARIPRPTSPHF